MSWFTDENSFSTKHTKRISIRVDQQISLQHEKIRETAQVMETQFEQLANVTMDNSQTVEFLQTFLVQENKHVSNKTVYTDLVGASKTKSTIALKQLLVCLMVLAIKVTLLVKLVEVHMVYTKQFLKKLIGIGMGQNVIEMVKLIQISSLDKMFELCKLWELTLLQFSSSKTR